MQVPPLPLLLLHSSSSNLTAAGGEVGEPAKFKHLVLHLLLESLNCCMDVSNFFGFVAKKGGDEDQGHTSLQRILVIWGFII